MISDLASWTFFSVCLCLMPFFYFFIFSHLSIVWNESLTSIIIQSVPVLYIHTIDLSR